jgi:hypothetical protein
LVLDEEIRAGVRLRGVGLGNTVTPREAMMEVALARRRLAALA